MQESSTCAPCLIHNLLGEDHEMLAVICILISDDLRDARPPFPETYHLVAFPKGTNGNGANGRIQSRYIPAASQYSYGSLFLVYLCHGFFFKNNPIIEIKQWHRETDLLIPFQYPVKIIVLGMLHILLGCPVILFGDIVQVVFEYDLYRFRIHIYQPGLHLALFILHIL